MFCEAYNQPLTDAAASGEQLSPALQQHLASCESCRAAFADEQSLFAAIDSGLRAAANSEVPPTLIPRVHVALNNEPVPQPYFLKWVFASATLACVLVVAITLQLRHRDAPVAVKTATAKSSAPTSPQLTNALSSIPPATHESPLQSNKAETAQPIAANTDASISADVLVPDEERVAFARFLAQASPPPVNISAGARLAPRAPQEFVQIAPVEIASLELRPLDKKEAREGQF